MYDLLFEISFTTDLLVEFHSADTKVAGGLVRSGSCSLRRLLMKEFVLAKSDSALKQALVNKSVGSELNRLWANVTSNFELVAEAIVKFSDDFEAAQGITTTTSATTTTVVCNDWVCEFAQLASGLHASFEEDFWMEPKEEASPSSAKSRLLVSLVELRRLKNGVIRLLFGMSIDRFNRFIAKNSQVIGFYKFCWLF